VEFASAKPAKKAEQELNGAELSGRELRVDFATPRGDGGRGGAAPRGRGKWVWFRDCPVIPLVSFDCVEIPYFCS